MCFGLERMEGVDGFSYTRNVSCGFAPDLFFHEFNAFLFGDRNSHFDAVVRYYWVRGGEYNPVSPFFMSTPAHFTKTSVRDSCLIPFDFASRKSILRGILKDTRVNKDFILVHALYSLGYRLWVYLLNNPKGTFYDSGI